MSNRDLKYRECLILEICINLDIGFNWMNKIARLCDSTANCHQNDFTHSFHKLSGARNKILGVEAVEYGRSKIINFKILSFGWKFEFYYFYLFVDRARIDQYPKPNGMSIWCILANFFKNPMNLWITYVSSILGQHLFSIYRFSVRFPFFFCRISFSFCSINKSQSCYRVEEFIEEISSACNSLGACCWTSLMWEGLDCAFVHPCAGVRREICVSDLISSATVGSSCNMVLSSDVYSLVFSKMYFQIQIFSIVAFCYRGK